VKELALEAGLPVLQPETPKDPAFVEQIRALRPDALAVVAYGHILPRDLLEVAPALNAHFSLLPRYRGAAPVQRALMDGATETGVSVFLLEPTVDTGPVVARERVTIEPDENAGELLARLAPIGARLLLGALDALEKGSVEPQPQDDSEASGAPKIKPEETEIDWNRSAKAIVDQVRALGPKPGAHTTFRGKRLLVHRARAAEGRGTPGTVVEATADGPAVAAGEGSVVLREVQPEGKRPMSGAEFVRGYHPETGAPFTEGLPG